MYFQYLRDILRDMSRDNLRDISRDNLRSSNIRFHLCLIAVQYDGSTTHDFRLRDGRREFFRSGPGGYVCGLRTT